MRRVLVIVLCIIFLTSCAPDQDALDVAQRLRDNILNAQGCSFTAKISADYGEEVHSFTMVCNFDKSGNLSFTVSEPESISGITGKIDNKESALTFDDNVLMFELLADDQITPVSAPWLLMKTICGGYISACSSNEDGYCIEYDDSFKGEPLLVQLQMNQQEVISYGEFIWEGRRILSVQILNFKLL